MRGYYQKPTVHGQQLVFVCEDDLWWSELRGGYAQRLTAAPGRCSDPHFSPDGRRLLYTGRDEGPGELYVLELDSGESRRLTYLGADTRAVGFSPDGRWAYFTTNAWQPFARLYVLGRAPIEGGPAQPLGLGPSSWISFSGPGRVLGRHTWDSARWKRYRGGTVGQFWIDHRGDDSWEPLQPVQGGNLTRPLWIGERIYFGSDHDGHGNLYSCLASGLDLQQHSHHRDFYLRHPAADAHTLVYQCGSDLHSMDLESRELRAIPLRLRAGGFGRRRKFAAGGHYLDHYALHPQGQAVACNVRGKALAFHPHEHSVHQLGQAQGVRYRLASWLPDGERLLTVSDQSGRERLEIYDWRGGEAEPLEVDHDLGRILKLEVCPQGSRAALTNHRYELWLLDWKSGEAEKLDHSEHDRLAGLSWSGCGHYLAYSLPTGRLSAQLRLWHRTTREITPLTEGCFRDVAPHFDPQGRYLYFLSLRVFNPVWDNMFFEMSFPNGMKPYLVLLRADQPSPFEHDPRPKAEEPAPAKRKKRAKEPEKPSTSIDLEGICQRIVAFPVGEGRYGAIRGSGDQVLISRFPAAGTLEEDHAAVPAQGTLYSYDLKTLEGKDLYTKVTGFTTSQDGKWLLYRSGARLRLVTADKKPESNEDSAGRKTGWIGAQRLRVSIEPQAEWRQMAREAWRLMGEHFWDPELSGLDWEAIYQRYLPLLDRVGSRSELSDWIWELQAEMGTSHAYESGGDYPDEPHFPMGKLGLEWSWDEDSGGYRIDRLVDGDCWDAEARSAARRPGHQLQPGDVVTHLAGKRLAAERAPEEALVFQARQEIEVRYLRQGEQRRSVLRPLRFETPARYRDWVDANRRRVHERSQGRLGYLHIPNMGPLGFAEFHRGYFAEVERQGLIVDVRYNGGGNVSGLLLEKLSRRIVGWDVPRHGRPVSYPMEAPRGPLVALTNEMAGSDGDIFSHCFKLLGLGPLVGTRTWGGVIGIWPRHKLVDGTQTTQPEFAFWFEDVGWRVENYGTDPDLAVEITPRDWLAGRDPQLETAIDTALERLSQHPAMPTFDRRR